MLPGAPPRPRETGVLVPPGVSDLEGGHQQGSYWPLVFVSVPTPDERVLRTSSRKSTRLSFTVTLQLPALLLKNQSAQSDNPVVGGKRTRSVAAGGAKQKVIDSLSASTSEDKTRKYSTVRSSDDDLAVDDDDRYRHLYLVDLEKLGETDYARFGVESDWYEFRILSLSLSLSLSPPTLVTHRRRRGRSLLPPLRSPGGRLAGTSASVAWIAGRS